MKCNNCSTIIKKEWKYALTQNVCPCCGSLIMDEETKELHNKFTSIMEVLIDKEFIHDWLSNYSFYKKDAKNIKQPKWDNSNDDNDSDSDVNNDEVIMSNNHIIENNPEIQKTIKNTANIKNIVKTIQDGNLNNMLLIKDINSIPDDDGGDNIEQMPVRSISKDLNMDDEKIPSQILRMAQKAKNKNGEKISDLDRLQEIYEKRNAKPNFGPR